MTNNDIKYKAIFGDMAQFNGMMPDCEFVDGTYGYKRVGKAFYYCERHNEKCGWSLSKKLRIDFRPIAMRRIIKEPNRWTVEDQKAGRLPEVGAELIHKTRGICYFVGVGLNENACWALKLQSGLIYIAEKSWCQPIETTAEKAQREENEFVKSEMKDTTLSIEWACIYERGVRAAYRKLKAPEVE